MERNLVKKFIFGVRSVSYRGVNDNLLALRGFAAIFVLIFHGMLAFQVAGKNVLIHQQLSYESMGQFINQLIVLLTNGSAAVSFFFVHSGFVLTLALEQRFRNRESKTGILILSYYVRRTLRLYPVIIVSVTVAWIYFYLFYIKIDSPPGSAWIGGFFKNGASLSELWMNIIMASNSLNKFSWSLLVEWHISLIMPLLYFLVRRNYGVLVVGLCMVAAYYYNIGDWIKGNLHTSGQPHYYYMHAFIVTFIGAFYIGAMATTCITSVGKFRQFLKQKLPLVHAILKVIYLPVSIAVLIFARPYFVPSVEYAFFVEGIASVFIIYTVYYQDDGILQRICSHRLSRFYGRISYSLYMFSGLAIYISASIIYYLIADNIIAESGLLFNLLTTVLGFGLVTLIGYISFHYVEAPFMLLGKHLSNRIEGRQKEFMVTPVN